MSTPLENLRIAFLEYVNSVSEDDSKNQCSLSKTDREQKIKEFVEGTGESLIIKSVRVTPITSYRAQKLKSNLISTLGEKSIYDKEYQIQPKFAEFILKYFKSNPSNSTTKPNPQKELIFELVSLSKNTLDFVVVFPNNKKYLLTEIDEVIEISEKTYITAKDNFEKEMAPEYDQLFKGNIFSKNKQNTRKIFIEYSNAFAGFCENVVKDPLNNKFTLHTGVVSFDLEDLFKGESLMNIYNMNQLTLFCQLEDKTKTKAPPVYDDVSPTYPPR